MSQRHVTVTAEIKNLLGSLMISGMPNGDDRLTVLVRHGGSRRARSILAANKWPLAIDVVEAPGSSHAWCVAELLRDKRLVSGILAAAMDASDVAEMRIERLGLLVTVAVLSGSRNRPPKLIVGRRRRLRVTRW
jgi:hypothetical protein